MKGKILFIDSVHPALQEKLEHNNWQCIDATTWDLNRILTSLSEFSGIIIRSRFKIDNSFLKKGTNLKFIARAGAGMENIDVAKASEMGIKCFNAPEGNRNAVAEHCLGMLLALFNNLVTADKEVKAGKWNREQNRGTELKDKTIAIIGFGNTGSTFAKKLQGMEAPILVYDPFIKINAVQWPWVKQVAMEMIFEKADIVSLHVPLTSETAELINKNYIANFTKSFYLLNTSRGKVVAINDLNEALQSKKILGAGIDVLEFESLSFENLQKENLPDSFNQLISFPNVILSPHVAGWTHESHALISIVLAEKIISEFN